MVIVALYILGWTGVTSLIYSMGTLTFVPTKPYGTIEADGLVKNLFIFQGFGLFWNLAMLLCMSNFVITGAVCFWYHKAQGAGKGGIIKTTIWWMLRYHLGTLAFGSLILAIIWVVKAVVEYIEVRSISRHFG